MSRRIIVWRNSSDYNDIMSDMLTEFLEEITKYGVYTYAAKGDFPLSEYEEGIDFYYTEKGMQLIERWHRRMKAVYDSIFDDDNFNPKSTYYKTF